MVVSTRLQAPATTSTKSLVKGFILTQRTDCKSPRTIEYYESNLRRFLWYANQQEWLDDVRQVTEWHIREFLAYTGGEANRWGLEGNGSESSRPKATSNATAGMAITSRWLEGGLSVSIPPEMITDQNQISTRK